MRRLFIRYLLRRPTSTKSRRPFATGALQAWARLVTGQTLYCPALFDLRSSAGRPAGRRCCGTDAVAGRKTAHHAAASLVRGRVGVKEARSHHATLLRTPATSNANDSTVVQKSLVQPRKIVCDTFERKSHCSRRLTRAPFALVPAVPYSPRSFRDHDSSPANLGPIEAAWSVETGHPTVRVIQRPTPLCHRRADSAEEDSQRPT